MTEKAADGFHRPDAQGARRYPEHPPRPMVYGGGDGLRYGD